MHPADAAPDEECVSEGLCRIPRHLPAHEVVVADALVVRTLAEDREGDVTRVQVGQLPDLGGDPRAPFALLGGGVAGMPHEVVGDELATALEGVEQGERPWGPTSSRVASTSTMGRRRRAAAMASPSWVCAFSRARRLSSSAWETRAGRPHMGSPGVSAVPVPRDPVFIDSSTMIASLHRVPRPPLRGSDMETCIYPCGATPYASGGEMVSTPRKATAEEP